MYSVVTEAPVHLSSLYEVDDISSPAASHVSVPDISACSATQRYVVVFQRTSRHNNDDIASPHQVFKCTVTDLANHTWVRILDVADWVKHLHSLHLGNSSSKWDTFFQIWSKCFHRPTRWTVTPSSNGCVQVQTSYELQTSIHLMGTWTLSPTATTSAAENSPATTSAAENSSPASVAVLAALDQHGLTYLTMHREQLRQKKKLTDQTNDVTALRAQITQLRSQLRQQQEQHDDEMRRLTSTVTNESISRADHNNMPVAASTALPSVSLSSLSSGSLAASAAASSKRIATTRKNMSILNPNMKRQKGPGGIKIL